MKLQAPTEAAAVGRRDYQEDRHFSMSSGGVVIQDQSTGLRFQAVEGWEGICFGVFDGHGGDRCAQHCSERFPDIWADVVTHDDPNDIGHIDVGPGGLRLWTDRLRRALHTLNLETQHMGDGCTASVVFMPWDASEVSVAVIGDSPVLVKTAAGTVWVARSTTSGPTRRRPPRRRPAGRTYTAGT